MPNYFLSLGRGRTPDGKKNFQRSPDGLRMVYSDGDSQSALAVAKACGHQNASLVPTDRPVTVLVDHCGNQVKVDDPDHAAMVTLPSGAVAVACGVEVLTFSLKDGAFECDQHPTISLRPFLNGYTVFQHGKPCTGVNTLAECKARVADWLLEGLLDA